MQIYSVFENEKGDWLRLLIKYSKKLKGKLGLLYRDVIINTIATSVICPRILRKAIFNAYGMKINCLAICARSFFSSKRISVGTGCFINYACFFDAQADIVIENNVFIGPRVSLITSAHEIGSAEKRAGKPFGKPIFVGGGLGLERTVLFLAE